MLSSFMTREQHWPQWANLPTLINAMEGTPPPTCPEAHLPGDQILQVDSSHQPSHHVIIVSTLGYLSLLESTPFIRAIQSVCSFILNDQTHWHKVVRTIPSSSC